ncbi:hypothetical protein Ciccas_002665 [Cichlidogyrus casuarinus]|uniref:Uncharacterized protein n=1 Tax=Cichlidogyrus casuarinus TaxID=1844966 RepID=A0ABD2QGZ5_9PLAT
MFNFSLTIATASFRPSKVLFMDGLGIKNVGNQEKLQEIAGHVEELDLSANSINSWKEVFILLQCLPSLRSLNLSYNPLGQNYVATKPFEIPVTTLETSKHLPIIEKRADRKDSFTSNSDSAHGSSLQSTPSTPTAAFSDQCSLSTYSNQVLEFEPAPSTAQDREIWLYDSTEDLTFGQNNEQEVEIQKVGEYLSPCKFALQRGLIRESTIYPQLNVLILNSTNIPWPWVSEILERCPK